MNFTDLKVDRGGYQCLTISITRRNLSSIRWTSFLPRDSGCFCLPGCSLPALCNGVNYSLILYIWFVTHSIRKTLVMNYMAQCKQLQNKTETHHMWSTNQEPVKQNWMLCSHGFFWVLGGEKMYVSKYHFCKLLEKISSY